jgi:uncharacterized FAD-dependent dehydrogenase
LIQKVTIIVSPPEANSEQKIRAYLSTYLKVNPKRIAYYQLVKRSIDARHANIKIQLTYVVFLDKYEPEKHEPAFLPKAINKKKQVIVVGTGPAGLFAALRLLMLGIKPIVIEQGKKVRERKIDIAQMYRKNEVNEQSNYCFGEGGAGTFSDGKLYTRSSKRGNIEWFLKVLVQAGANENILVEAHPHIGSDKLPTIIQTIRSWILDAGGEIYFSSKLTNLLLEDNVCKGVEINNKEKLFADAVILATGHSSAFIYEMLNNCGVILQPKGFALGVRIEQPQKTVNLIQYHGEKYIKYLPAAEYKLVEQVNDRGVYSFCMCPGGMVVPASTQKGYTVVNGMSASHRASTYANSGFVVEIRPEDISKHPTAFDLLKFQQQIENSAYNAVGDGLKAPAQRVVDFLNGKTSSSLPKSSYIPGIVSSSMHEWLPLFVSERLKGAFSKMQTKMKNFIDESIMIGVESRTSSPVRIPRNDETMEQIEIKNLYPCGEGAGYAGGITSSAFDGIAVADILAKRFTES